MHWIGPKWEGRVLLFLHLCVFLQCAKKIAFVDYRPTALIPEHPFPKQLRPKFAATQHLLDLGVSPSNIIIAGDSSGGNLVLQLASQLLHPHPSLPIIHLPSRAGTETDVNSLEVFPEVFGGMLLILPWLEYNVDAPSFARNCARDLIRLNAWELCAKIV